MEGPFSFWGYKEQESYLILPEHDDDDDDDNDESKNKENISFKYTSGSEVIFKLNCNVTFKNKSLTYYGWHNTFIIQVTNLLAW
jgi:hypothetical protein